MAGTIWHEPPQGWSDQLVSMESGLDGRNNPTSAAAAVQQPIEVSMESGLDGRNNSSPRKAALTRNFTSACELSAPPGPIKPLC